MSKPLPYGRQWVDATDVAAVAAQLSDDWLTQGPTIAKFEQALCEITRARFAVAVSSGTAALHLACLAAGITSGDVAFVPDITFVATANAVRYAGGRPILVDVAPDSASIDADALQTAIDNALHDGVRIKAILPVSFAGAPANLPHLRTVADELGASLIEDAAHSLGATYTAGAAVHRSASCAHSDMATLSFHPVKHLTTGEGGAITTNNSALYAKLCDLRTHGITKDPARLSRNDGPWFYEQQSLGFNYRLTDFQCALGLSQAERFPKFLGRRRDIAARYDEAFFQDGRVEPLAIPAGVTSAYHLYVLRLVARGAETIDAIAARRKTLFVKLREAGIAAQVHYIPLHIQPDFRRNGLAGGQFPGADRYYAGCVSVPMYPAMDDDDVAAVIGAVRHALAER